MLPGGVKVKERRTEDATAGTQGSLPSRAVGEDLQPQDSASKSICHARGIGKHEVSFPRKEEEKISEGAHHEAGGEVSTSNVAVDDAAVWQEAISAGLHHTFP